MARCLAFCVCFLVILLWPTSLRAQQSFNLSFEDLGSDPAKPKDWWTDTGVSLDSETAHSGRQSLRITSDGKNKAGWKAVRPLPVALIAGRRTRLTGFVKIDSASKGVACLALTAENDSLKQDGLEVGQTLSPGLKKGWQRLSVELQPSLDISNAYIEVRMEGAGTAWFDSLDLSIDDLPYAEAFRRRFGLLKAQELNWLTSHLSPLQTDDPDGKIDDLRPIRDIVGKARIVALGEGTHGTSEFFRMKHRLTRFLVNEMGFDYIAIELGMADVKKLNDFILGGTGDLDAKFRQMPAGLYSVQEILDLVRWLRETNARGKRKIQLCGMDIGRPTLPAENVRQFISTRDRGYLHDVDHAYDRLDYFSPTMLCNQAQEVLDILEQRRASYLQEFSLEETDWVIQNARLVRQYFGWVAPGRFSPTGRGYRARCMADNLAWILDCAPNDAKIVIWAHNGHVSREPGEMGMHLAARFGKKMVVIGGTCHEGDYRAYSWPNGVLRDFTIDPSAEGSLEWRLHKLGVSRAILDLRGVSEKDIASAWLSSPISFRFLGSLGRNEPKNQFKTSRIASDFDAIFFVNKSTPSRMAQGNTVPSTSSQLFRTE
ncbi:hypothetical protein BH10PLA2_BH10PLA2_10950 [soil metagenome]